MTQSPAPRALLWQAGMTSLPAGSWGHGRAETGSRLLSSGVPVTDVTRAHGLGCRAPGGRTRAACGSSSRPAQPREWEPGQRPLPCSARSPGWPTPEVKGLLDVSSEAPPESPMPVPARVGVPETWRREQWQPQLPGPAQQCPLPDCVSMPVWLLGQGGDGDQEDALVPVRITARQCVSRSRDTAVRCEGARFRAEGGSAIISPEPGAQQWPGAVALASLPVPNQDGLRPPSRLVRT